LGEPNKTYDIKIRCYEFSKAVVLFINRHEFKRIHAALIDQLLRSATSIGANVIEAKSGNSKKNMISFFSISLRSANETKYWLCLVRDTLNVDHSEANNLIKEADELSKIIAKSILTLKQKEKVIGRI
jgi:four helix bundle protein